MKNDLNFSTKPCNICRATNTDIVFQHTAFTIVRCKNCKLTYADEHMSNEDFLSYYTGDYYGRTYKFCQENIAFKIAKNYLDEFCRFDNFLIGKGRLLDLGCARGSFIRELIKSETGSRWEAEGIDINPYEITLGQLNNAPVRLGNIVTMDIPSNSYDVVTCFSILEHLQDPRKALQNIARSLKTNGKIFLIVPNADSLILALGRLLSYIPSKTYYRLAQQIYHENHLYYFNRDTITRILQNSGFRPQKIYCLPSYFENHPGNFCIALGSTILRFFSRSMKRQSMLAAIAEKY